MLGFLLVAVHVLVCLFLMLVILVQAARGGGLAGLFSGQASDALFAAGSRNPLRRVTAIAACLFFVLCILLGYYFRPGEAAPKKPPPVSPSGPEPGKPPTPS